MKMKLLWAKCTQIKISDPVVFIFLHTIVLFYIYVCFTLHLLYILYTETEVRDVECVLSHQPRLIFTS